MNGAQYIVKFLEDKGVDVVFGYPGGQVIFFYDVLGRSTKIKHVLTRHEQGAVHAADGYARVTGKPGVCIATSGPGATNLVTGIANAYLDSIPLIAITGQVGLASIGRDSFQEADIVGITMPITKHSYLVKELDKLPSIMEEAWYVATSGRPGPVLIDVPKDVFMGEMDFSNIPVAIATRKRPLKNGLDDQLAKVIAALSEAKKPLIFAGGGVISGGATSELASLLAITGFPLVTSLMGKGAVPETQPGVLGMVGMHGKAVANLALTSCDLLIGLGVRFSDRVTGKPEDFIPNSKIIHVDIDPAELRKNVNTHIPVVCDIHKFLRELTRKLKEANLVFSNQEWQETIDAWQETYPLQYTKSSTIKPQQLIEEVAAQAGSEAIVVTDVGQHQMFTAQYYPIGGVRNFLSSGGLGTMGFGLPAAMGASFGRQGENVVLFAGDGGVQMCIQELATIAHHRLPVKIFVLDNSCLGMVRQWQELFYQRHYSNTILEGNPDFVKLAEAYGIKALKLCSPTELQDVIKEALSIPGPVLIHCVVEQEENVLPMVAPGGKPNEMLGRWQGEAHISRLS